MKNKNIQKKCRNKLLQCVCLVPNDFSDKCMECHCMFTMRNRRHHCYKIKCGKLVCGQCSNFKIKDPKSTDIKDQIRVCKSCYIKHKQQQLDAAYAAKLKFISYIIIIIMTICIVIFFFFKLYKTQSV